MGGLFAKLREMLFSKKLELVLLGLENCGKTTFTNQLVYGEPKKPMPTLGLSVKYAKKDSNGMNICCRSVYENLGSWWTKNI
jgi:Arf/Sar family protein